VHAVLQVQTPAVQLSPKLHVLPPQEPPPVVPVVPVVVVVVVPVVPLVGVPEQVQVTVSQTRPELRQGVQSQPEVPELPDVPEVNSPEAPPLELTVCEPLPPLLRFAPLELDVATPVLPWGKVQTPATQVSSMEHSWQSPPLMPQLSVDDTWQTPEASQHPEQFEVEHFVLHPNPIALPSTHVIAKTKMKRRVTAASQRTAQLWH
jgi:hypothetical protein